MHGQVDVSQYFARWATSVDEYVEQCCKFGRFVNALTQSSQWISTVQSCLDGDRQRRPARRSYRPDWCDRTSSAIGTGFWLAWLVVVETVVDLAIAIHRRRREPLKEEPSGPLWLMLAFYVPLMVVTLPVLFWLLVTRGGALS